MEDRLIKLYDYMEDKGIESISSNFSDEKSAFALVDGDVEAVIINHKLINSAYEETCIVAEEVGHIETGALYKLKYKNQPKFATTVSQAEHRAKDWAFSFLIPIDKLKEVLESNYIQNDYEAAEALEVDVDTFLKSIDMYKRKGLLPHT